MAGHRPAKRSFEASFGQDAGGSIPAVDEATEPALDVVDVELVRTEPLTIRERWRLRHKNRVTQRLPAFPDTQQVSSQSQAALQPVSYAHDRDGADLGYVGTIPIESQTQFIPDASLYEVAYEPVAQATTSQDFGTQATVIFTESQQGSLEGSMVATQIFDSQQPSSLSASQSQPVDSGVECPICLEPYRELKSQGVFLMGLNCGHVVCSTCAQNSVNITRECPVCRAKLKKSGIRKMFL